METYLKQGKFRKALTIVDWTDESQVVNLTAPLLEKGQTNKALKILNRHFESTKANWGAHFLRALWLDNQGQLNDPRWRKSVVAFLQNKDVRLYHDWDICKGMLLRLLQHAPPRKDILDTIDLWIGEIEEAQLLTAVSLYWLCCEDESNEQL